MSSDPTKCFEIIKKQFERNHYILSEIIPVQNKILGYLGRYYYLKGKKVSSQNPSETCDTTFFLKIVPADKKQKRFIEESNVFNTEIAIYTLVLRKMTLNFVPECITSMKDRFLVLEDMNSKGFQMQDKFEPLGMAFCKSALETIGRFHGQSKIFEHKNRTNILKFLQKKNVDLHSPDRLMQEALITNIEGVGSIIDFLPDCKNEGWKKVKEKLRNEAKIYYNKIKSSKEEKVLCHSDLWSNNLLFKLDSDENLIHCCLLDFQLARYAPPALDVLIFLYFTTSRKLRKKYFNTLIRTYYDSLAETLKLEGMDVKKIFPWTNFMTSIESLRFACMTAVLGFISIDLLESDTDKKGAVTHEEVWNHLSRNTAPLVLKQFKEVLHYRKRILDSLTEMYELLADKEH